jgi:hypothetical protein
MFIKYVRAKYESLYPACKREQPAYCNGDSLIGPPDQPAFATIAGILKLPTEFRNK